MNGGTLPEVHARGTASVSWPEPEPGSRWVDGDGNVRVVTRSDQQLVTLDETVLLDTPGFWRTFRRAE